MDPDAAPDPAPDAGLALALVAELAKKTGVSWLSYDGQQHAVWHTWTDAGDAAGGGALALVSGGPEQPLPDLPDDARVEITMRSKDNGGRLLTWVGRASVVRPGDEQWDTTTAALVAGRLNLADLSTAADDWADTSVVRRVVPTGEVLEAPGRLSDDAHLATPRPTPATTRGRLPRVLHRRVKRRPRLS